MDASLIRRVVFLGGFGYVVVVAFLQTFYGVSFVVAKSFHEGIIISFSSGQWFGYFEL